MPTLAGSAPPAPEGAINEIRGFLYLSDVFRYIESFRLRGHQIGRKVGDMVEVLTQGMLLRDRELWRRIKSEPKVLGFTGAEHKVEFALCELDAGGEADLSKLFGIIECKRVGVEVTKHRRCKDGGIRLRVGETYDHGMGPQWRDTKASFGITLLNVSPPRARVRVTVSDGGAVVEKSDCVIPDGGRFRLALCEDGSIAVLGDDTDLRHLPSHIRDCNIVHVRSVMEDSASLHVDDCLAGPQTIEKAKQAALVAMDVRKRIQGVWGKEEVPGGDDRMVSVLVIGEAGHWEPKSRSVVRKCIDHNVILVDEVVIEAFQLFEQQYGREFLEAIS